MSMTTEEYWDVSRRAAVSRVEAGRSPGPRYGAGRPVLWYDQRFGEGLTLTGTVDCPVALRVGATQEALDVAIVASMAGTLEAAEGATITLIPLEADSPDGAFTEAGPSVCVKAPKGGMSAEAGDLFVRLPIGNRARPWLEVRLVVDGAVTGAADVGLAYLPR